MSALALDRQDAVRSHRARSPPTGNLRRRQASAGSSMSAHGGGDDRRRRAGHRRLLGHPAGRQRAQPRFLTTTRRSAASAAGSPRRSSAALIVAPATVIAAPIGVLTALYLTEFAGPRSRSGDPAARARPAQRPAHDRRRHLRLRRARHPRRRERLRRLSRPGDHHGAADRPLQPGGAAAGPRGAARRRRRPRGRPLAHDPRRDRAQRAGGHRHRARSSRWRGPPARRLRCFSPTSLSDPARTTFNLFGPPCPTFPSGSSTTPSSRRRPVSRGPGARARAPGHSSCWRTSARGCCWPAAGGRWAYEHADSSVERARTTGGRPGAAIAATARTDAAAPPPARAAVDSGRQAARSCSISATSSPPTATTRALDWTTMTI